MLLKQLKYFITIVECGNFTFAENLEEANLLVASNKGFLPIESSKKQIKSESSMIYIPLYFKESQLSRKYYAFWKKDNNNEIIESFANILNKMF